MLLQWARAYLASQRGARLITGERLEGGAGFIQMSENPGVRSPIMGDQLHFVSGPRWEVGPALSSFRSRVSVHDTLEGSFYLSQFLDSNTGFAAQREVHDKHP
jgi:hypothetical protein